MDGVDRTFNVWIWGSRRRPPIFLRLGHRLHGPAKEGRQPAAIDFHEAAFRQPDDRQGREHHLPFVGHSPVSARTRRHGHDRRHFGAGGAGRTRWRRRSVSAGAARQAPRGGRATARRARGAARPQAPVAAAHNRKRRRRRRRDRAEGPAARAGAAGSVSAGGAPPGGGGTTGGGGPTGGTSAAAARRAVWGPPARPRQIVGGRRRCALQKVQRRAAAPAAARAPRRRVRSGWRCSHWPQASSAVRNSSRVPSLSRARSNVTPVPGPRRPGQEVGANFIIVVTACGLPRACGLQAPSASPRTTRHRQRREHRHQRNAGGRGRGDRRIGNHRYTLGPPGPAAAAGAARARLLRRRAWPALIACSGRRARAISQLADISDVTDKVSGDAVVGFDNESTRSSCAGSARISRPRHSASPRA